MRKKFLGAVVLLVALSMVFSSFALADTQIKQSNTEISTTNEGTAQGARGDVVWDNGMAYTGLLAAQEPVTTAGLDAYPADDFMFDVDTEVCDVHWVGGYYGGTPPWPEWPWCILFYYDRGDGLAPGNTYIGPFCYNWVDIDKTVLEEGYWTMSVDLPENYIFYGDTKYWISIWAVGDHFPQSGWGYHDDLITLHQAVFKSEHFGILDWTDLSLVIGTQADMCFQLTTKEEPCEPGIDVEKQVQDKNGNWVDADDMATALDVAICTDIIFRIVIKNTGTCDLIDIVVKDIMHDSLKFISADPDPDHFEYIPPEYLIEWFFAGPLPPGATIEIYITAHVEGPECSYDYNKVDVTATCIHGVTVTDHDECWIHAVEKGRSINTPFLTWLQNHPNMFPLIQKMVKLLGLF
jgi:hypothetical protein